MVGSENGSKNADVARFYAGKAWEALLFNNSRYEYCTNII